MKIKLFEEYNELDFSKYNIISSDEYYKYLNYDNLIKLSENELIKVKKLGDIHERECKNLISNNNIYYYFYLMNKNSPIITIEIIKLEDDYYIVHFSYIYKYYIKCDQLSELLKLLKYMNNNEN